MLTERNHSEAIAAIRAMAEQGYTSGAIITALQSAYSLTVERCVVMAIIEDRSHQCAVCDDTCYSRRATRGANRVCGDMRCKNYDGKRRTKRTHDLPTNWASWGYGPYSEKGPRDAAL